MLKEHYKYNTIWTLEEKKKLTFPVGNSYFYQKNNTSSLCHVLVLAPNNFLPGYSLTTLVYDFCNNLFQIQEWVISL